MYVEYNNTPHVSQTLSTPEPTYAVIEVHRAKPAFKLWLETDEGYVFGPGVYSLLKRIQEKGTLKEAAASLGMSYRFAWGLIKRAEEKLGEPLISATKGGRHGGGSTEITDLGRQYVDDFERFRRLMDEVYKAEEGLGAEVNGTVIDVNRVEDRVECRVELQGKTIKVSARAGAAKKRIGDKVTLRVTMEP